MYYLIGTDLPSVGGHEHNLQVFTSSPSILILPTFMAVYDQAKPVKPTSGGEGGSDQVFVNLLDYLAFSGSVSTRDRKIPKVSPSMYKPLQI